MATKLKAIYMCDACEQVEQDNPECPECKEVMREIGWIELNDSAGNFALGNDA